MESDLEETILESSNIVIQPKIRKHSKSFVSLGMTRVPSVDKQNPLTNSPVER
jgi:hypothetical protein